MLHPLLLYSQLPLLFLHMYMPVCSFFISSNSIINNHSANFFNIITLSSFLSRLISLIFVFFFQFLGVYTQAGITCKKTCKNAKLIFTRVQVNFRFSVVDFLRNFLKRIQPVMFGQRFDIPVSSSMNLFLFLTRKTLLLLSSSFNLPCRFNTISNTPNYRCDSQT